MRYDPALDAALAGTFSIGGDLDVVRLGFGAIRTLLDTGVIRHAGLSEVDVSITAAARAIFPLPTVQNRYNLADGAHEAALEYCDREGIGFIPWFPLAAGRLTGPGTLLERIAAGHGASAGQIALAWLLRRSRVILPIPGISQVDHLEENARAATIRLSETEFEAFNAAGRN